MTLDREAITVHERAETDGGHESLVTVADPKYKNGRISAIVAGAHVSDVCGPWIRCYALASPSNDVFGQVREAETAVSDMVERLGEKGPDKSVSGAGLIDMFHFMETGDREYKKGEGIDVRVELHRIEWPSCSVPSTRARSRFLWISCGDAGRAEQGPSADDPCQ